MSNDDLLANTNMTIHEHQTRVLLSVPMELLRAPAPLRDLSSEQVEQMVASAREHAQGPSLEQAPFPPILCSRDGLVLHGFHRLEAATRLECKTVLCHVLRESLRDTPDPAVPVPLRALALGIRDHMQTENVLAFGLATRLNILKRCVFQDGILEGNVTN